MKLAKRAVSVLLCLMLLISVFSTSAVFFAAETAEENGFSDAAMELDKEFAYNGTLGAIYSPKATTFKVWAPLATEVKLNRYATGSNKEEGAQNLGTIEMEKLMEGDDWTGVWTITVEGDLKNTYYTYSITNPTHIYYDEPGLAYVTHETQDVYSYAVGVNGDRSMVVDLSETDPDGWDSDSHIYVDQQSDAIVWEVQVKDFSYNPNSGVSEANRGKYLAFTETGTTLDGEGNIATGIDYLKSLGVTHVQINPFYDFATIDEDRNTTDDSEFNWGYDPKNYGVPEGSYSSNPYDGNVRIREAKAMIKALHDAGIGVIMDVVYNHTYSVDSCFNYSVPEYYYRMAANGGYSQQSGCGNDTASERAMYRKYMREMLQYWTNEYHIDGYRFDLMGVHDGETMNLIREDMDAIDSRIIMYGEGWGGNTVYDPTTCTGADTFMCTQTNSANISTRIGFFNDQIRDGIKAGVFDGETASGFVSGNKSYAKNIRYGVYGNAFGKPTWTAQAPEQCVTYASCHDNMTLYDKLVAINHGTTVDYRARYSDCIEQNKLTAGIISSCQGIDFILAGEEMGRSKDGDENSYKSAATLNMIDWSLLRTNADLVSYYKGMFALRKAFSPFTAPIKDELDDSYAITFNDAINLQATVVAFTVDNTVEGEWKKMVVLYNGGTTADSYTFKADANMDEDTDWVIIANDKCAGVSELGTAKGLTFEVAPSSVLIAVDKASFEEANVQSDYVKMIVNDVDSKNGNVLSSKVILGTPGEGYDVAPDGSIPLKYELDHVDGNTQGTFGDEDFEVSFMYKNYIPDSFLLPNGDVNDDNDISILDATAIQRHLARLTTLDEEHLKRGDYNYSDDTDILDATMLQRYLAKMNVSVFKVKTLHMGTRPGESARSIAMPSVKEYRLGASYTTEPSTIAYYELDGIPDNASGKVINDVTVTYRYTYNVLSPTIHVKHDGDQTWAPSLWAWAYDESGKAINCYEKWPGLEMTNPDADGWYTTTFPIPGGLDYYFIISNGGSPQTNDYGPIKYADYPEIWVVIRDDKIAMGDGSWIEYYNYNPDTAN